MSAVYNRQDCPGWPRMTTEHRRDGSFCSGCGHRVHGRPDNEDEARRVLLHYLERKP